MPNKLDLVEELEVTTRAQWRAWLKKNHDRKDGIWLITWKKATPSRYVSYAETVEEALCFGWIDSHPRKLDDQRRKLYFCPRRPKSVWSSLNKQRIKSLIENGSMTPAGLSKIEAAKANGSWFALDNIETMEMPLDLQKVLTRNTTAKANFDAFPPGSRKFILYWITSAKTEATRSKRIKEVVQKAAKNIRANQQ